MRLTLRQAAVVTTALIGLSTMASAAPPGAADSTVITPPSPSAANPSATSPSAASPAEPRGLTEKIEQRLTDLHAKLQITSAQEPQWRRFAQVMRDNGRKMDQTFASRVQLMPTMNAEENMRSYARISMQHAQDVAGLVPVFNALYASMSDSQKHTADQVFRDDANRGDQTAHSQESGNVRAN